MKKLETQDIVKDSAEVKESGMDWKETYAVIYYSIEKNTGRVMRAGNSLFWYEILENKQAQVHVFNVDPYQEFLKNTRDFGKAMQKAGFEYMFCDTVVQQTVNAFKNIQLPNEAQDTGEKFNGKPIYRVVVELK